MLYYVPAIVALCLYWSALGPVEGLIGHDYAHEWSRLALGIFHARQNGVWSIPHFTPSLCGGIPLFANPQSAYFSLPQWLSLYWDPLTAARVSILIFQSVGYLVLVRALKRFCDASDFAAHLGSLCFLLNGFLFANLLVGHLTHHGFPLLTVVVYALFRPYPRRDWGFLRTMFCLAGVGLYLVYSGGVHVIVLGLALIGFLTPMAVWRTRHPRNLLVLGLGSVLLVIAGSSAKLALAMAFSASFVAHPVDLSSEPVLSQLLRYFWFIPALTPSFLPFGRLWLGAWEFVGFFSKLALPALVLVILTSTRSRLDRTKTLTYVIFTLMFALVATGRLGPGLPGLGWYHNPIKLLGMLSLPLALAVTEAAQLVSTRVRYPLRVFGGLALLLLWEFQSGAGFFREKRLGLTETYNPEIFQKIRTRPALPEVKQVVAQPKKDLNAILRGASNLLCYEPVFGYRLEALRTKLQVGSTSLIENDSYNLNHPGCFLDPQFYGCRPFDRIPHSQPAAMQAFQQGLASAFVLPPWVVWNLRLNVLVVGLVGLLIVLLTLRRI